MTYDCMIRCDLSVSGHRFTDSDTFVLYSGLGAGMTTTCAGHEALIPLELVYHGGRHY